MQVHDLPGDDRVITLDESEQFAFVPAVTEGSEDAAWYATRVQTVTVFGETGVRPGYYTVAGEQISFPGPRDEAYWVMPVEFTDSGPLPPHVRRHVEDIVPVVDTPAKVIGLAGKQAEHDVVRIGSVGDEGPSKLGELDSALERSRRRAKFELLDGEGQQRVLQVHRPSQPNRLADGYRELDTPTPPQDKLPPPSAFLNNSQVWNRGGGAR